jgi:hypothetical protein
MFKKLLSFTVALLLIFSCMSVVASAEGITDIEPNDEPATAQVIEPNASVSGVLPAPNLEAEEPYMDMDIYTRGRVCRKNCFSSFLNSFYG